MASPLCDALKAKILADCGGDPGTAAQAVLELLKIVAILEAKP